MRYGGRQKGTPNKLTTELRETLRNLVDEHLVKDMSFLTPKERAYLLVKLLPYIIPHKHEIDISEALNEPLVITLSISDDDEVTKVHQQR